MISDRKTISLVLFFFPRHDLSDGALRRLYIDPPFHAPVLFYSEPYSQSSGSAINQVFFFSYSGLPLLRMLI